MYWPAPYLSCFSSRLHHSEGSSSPISGRQYYLLSGDAGYVFQLSSHCKDSPTNTISFAATCSLLVFYSGEWRKLHNEELNELYSVPNILRVVKSRRMRWAGHVARMGEYRGVHRVLVGKPE
jgi:hypothetical protein